jgi:death-on-curing protein
MSGSEVEPRFLTIDEVLVLHELAIRAFGGQSGIRDRALLESALAQPLQGTASGYVHKFPFEMAAAYGYHLARNHPFIDGNKRIAWLALQVFLEKNGYRFAALSAECTATMLAVASGAMDKVGFAQWIERFVSRG